MPAGVPSLVSLEDAAIQLRLDNDASGDWLSIFIPAVSGAVLSWLKDSWRAYEWEVDSNGDIVHDSAGRPILALDSSGEPIVHPTVRAAVLVELAQQNSFRTGDKAPGVPEHWGHGYVLGAGATSLLMGRRKTTVV